MKKDVRLGVRSPAARLHEVLPPSPGKSRTAPTAVLGAVNSAMTANFKKTVTFGPAAGTGGTYRRIGPL